MGRPRWPLAALSVLATLLWFAFSALAFEPGKARWSIKVSPMGSILATPGTTVCCPATEAS